MAAIKIKRKPVKISSNMTPMQIRRKQVTINEKLSALQLQLHTLKELCPQRIGRTKLSGNASALLL